MNKYAKKLFWVCWNPIRLVYWVIVRPKTYGVKCVLESEGKILLIRNSYGHKRWTFPGGGIHSGETPDQAARRECVEETGLEPGELAYVGSYFSSRQFKQDTVYCYYSASAFGEMRVDIHEVLEARWFPLNELPHPQSFAIGEIMPLVLQHKKGQNHQE